MLRCCGIEFDSCVGCVSCQTPARYFGAVGQRLEARILKLQITTRGGHVAVHQIGKMGFEIVPRVIVQIDLQASDLGASRRDPNGLHIVWREVDSPRLYVVGKVDVLSGCGRVVRWLYQWLKS